MTAQLTYPAQGRGAWPSSGMGGTLRSDGTGPGRYYRSRAGAMSPIGAIGYTADRLSKACSVNDYATYRAVVAIQTELANRGLMGSDLRPIVADGIWGQNTDVAVKAFQSRERDLVPDGVFGPASARAMFAPLAQHFAAQVNKDPALTRIMVGTLTVESAWDPGAVGVSTPQDLGLAQINGPAHPGMTAQSRLDPRVVFPYIADFILNNLNAMNWNERDATAAYRYGITGAKQWVSAGRPQTWKATDAWAYIDKILGAGA